MGFFRKWRAPATVALSGTFALLAQTWYKETGVGWFLVLAISCVVIGALAVPFFKHLDEKDELDALQKYQLQIGDGLQPLLQQLVKLGESNSVPEAKTNLHQLIVAAIEAARHVAGQGRVRATYFRALPPAGRLKARLVPGPHVGRSTSPSSVFAKGTPEGDYIFEVLSKDGYVFYEDIKDCDLPGWDPHRKRDYGTFASVPVRGKSVVYGMLSVDAPSPGDLTHNSVTFIRCVGVLLAAGIAGVKHYAPSPAPNTTPVSLGRGRRKR